MLLPDVDFVPTQGDILKIFKGGCDLRDAGRYERALDVFNVGLDWARGMEDTEGIVTMFGELAATAMNMKIMGVRYLRTGSPRRAAELLKGATEALLRIFPDDDPCVDASRVALRAARAQLKEEEEHWEFVCVDVTQAFDIRPFMLTNSYCGALFAGANEESMDLGDKGREDISAALERSFVEDEDKGVSQGD